MLSPGAENNKRSLHWSRDDMCVCMPVYVRYAKLTKPYANLCIMRVFDKHTHRRMSRNTLEIVRLSTVFMVMCISVLWSMISLSYKK